MYVFELKNFVKYYKKKPITVFWRNHAKCEYLLPKNSGGLEGGLTKELCLQESSNMWHQFLVEEVKGQNGFIWK